MWICIYLLAGVLVVSFCVLWNEWLAKHINHDYVRREWQDPAIAVFGVIITVVLWLPIISIVVLVNLERYLYRRKLLRGIEEEIKKLENN